MNQRMKKKRTKNCEKKRRKILYGGKKYKDKISFTERKKEICEKRRTNE